MEHKLVTALGALAAATAMLTAPAVTMAQSQSDQKMYATTLIENGPSQLGGSFTGTLTIAVSNDGIVSGWYNPDYQSGFVPVTGSDKEGKLRLNIGANGLLQVDADFQKNGSLVGSAIELSRPAGDMTRPATFDFVAQPTTT